MHCWNENVLLFQVSAMIVTILLLNELKSTSGCTMLEYRRLFELDFSLPDDIKVPLILLNPPATQAISLKLQPIFKLLEDPHSIKS